MTKVVFYKKLNPNHRKYVEGLAGSSKRRSLLQTPVPPQNGTPRSSDPDNIGCCHNIGAHIMVHAASHCSSCLV